MIKIWAPIIFENSISKNFHWPTNFRHYIINLETSYKNWVTFEFSIFVILTNNFYAF